MIWNEDFAFFVLINSINSLYQKNIVIFMFIWLSFLYLSYSLFAVLFLVLSIKLFISQHLYLLFESLVHLIIYVLANLFICWSIFSFAYLLIYLFNYLFFYLFIYFFFYSSIYMSIYLSIYLSIYISIYISIYLFVYLFIYLLTYLPIYLSFCIIFFSSLPQAAFLSYCFIIHYCTTLSLLFFFSHDLLQTFLLEYILTSGIYSYF